MKKIFIPVVLSLLYSGISAQQSMTNSGNLQLHPDAGVTSSGHFNNTSTGVLVNNGRLSIKGDVTNDQASMNAGTGSLYLEGSSPQNIYGSATFKTFDLFSDNTAGILLNNSLSISGLHTFTNGLIGGSYSSTHYLVYEAGSVHTGSNDTRHVNAWVKKVGNTDFTFPVGNALYERNITLSGLSAVSEFNCYYLSPTQHVYNLWSPLVQVRVNEYWQLDKISGGDAQVTLNWNHAKVPMDNIILADIRAAYYGSGNWRSAGGSASGTVTSTGMITSAAIGSFGEMTLGYTSSPVPLNIISFMAERRAGTSFLTWVTVYEDNVDHFDIQRSYDGINYSSIGTVTARNTSSRQTYLFEDPSPLNGIAYYRLKSIDLDRKTSFSRIAVVTENSHMATGLYALNPARSVITVFNKTGQEGNFDYRLLTMTGQLLLKGTIIIAGNGGTVLSLPSYITTGLYILELGNGRIPTRQKIIIEK